MRQWLENIFCYFVRFYIQIQELLSFSLHVFKTKSCQELIIAFHTLQSRSYKNYVDDHETDFTFCKKYWSVCKFYSMFRQNFWVNLGVCVSEQLLKHPSTILILKSTMTHSKSQTHQLFEHGQFLKIKATIFNAMNVCLVIGCTDK